MQTAAAYIRVSTEDQIEYSPESQLSRIKEYAKNHDILLLEDNIYVDEGISGRHTKKREQFNLMIARAKQKPKPFDVILVWKFSRFARNREDSIVYKSMLRKQCDIQVISISEALGDDKTSILIEALIEAMDEYYSINLAEEVKRGMTEKVRRGEPVTAPPLGYDIVDKVYVPNENAVYIKKIFNDFLMGKGMRRIACELNDMGVKTTRGNEMDNRSIEYILNNPVYNGKIRWCPTGRASSKRDFKNPDNMITQGSHEAIIEDDVFNKAQEKLSEMKRTHATYSRNDDKVGFMLKGLVRCSNCGATLVMGSKSGQYLQCHRYAKGQCKVSHSLSIPKANEMVIAALKDATIGGNIAVEIKKKTNEEERFVDLEKLLKNEMMKLKRIKLAFQEGIDTVEEYKANKAEITSRIEMIEREMRKSDDKSPEIDTKRIRDKIINLVKTLENDRISLETKNAALKSVISKIIYNKAEKRLQLFFWV